MLYGSQINLCLISTKSRVIRTFRKIGPPLFPSSGNQSFRYIVRFTSTLSFECFRVRLISSVPYHFPVLQPFHAIAFIYFSFGVRSIEFVSRSRTCCWLGHVRFQFVCFPSSFPPNRELPELFERSGHPCSHHFSLDFFIIMKRGL